MVAAVTNPAASSAEARLRGMGMVGLNADWISSAYFLGPGIPNRTPGAAYLLDNEDGEWEIVRRWYADDDYAGLPAQYREYADGNDAIVRVSPIFDTVEDAFAWIDAGGLATRNPPLRRNDAKSDRTLTSPSYAVRLSALAQRSKLTELSLALMRQQSEIDLALGSLRDVKIGTEERTASKRRKQAFEALQILRRAQSEARANNNVLPLLSDAERSVLATWSGMGGLFRSCSELTPEQIALLKPDQQEYCRMETERLAGKARGLSERELPQIPLDLRFAFEGMTAQYFTPLTVAEGMAKRALAVWDESNGHRRPVRIMEPSAGSGRMVAGWRRANLPEAEWTLVEWDRDQADMLSLTYGVDPACRVFAGPLESYIAEYPPAIAANQVDLVIANPPYADRRPGSKKADAPYAKINENQNYFVLRSLDYLRPRGVTIQLIPWGILTAKTGEDAKVREEMLRRAHFFGAVEVPSDMFPGSLMNLVLVVLGKRPARLDAVLPEDREIAEGRYFRKPTPATPEGPHMGVHDVSSRNYRPGLRTGAFDFDKLVEFTSRVPPASYHVEVVATPTEIAAEKAVRNNRLGISVADAVSIGELLGSRCIALREARVTDGAKARQLIEELRPDLSAYAARFGNPRTATLPSDYKPTASWYALVSAFTADGGFSELIGDEVPGKVSGYKGDGTPADVVRFLSARRGSASVSEIEAILGERVDVRALLLHPDVYLYPERMPAEQELCFMRRQEFLSGQCYTRLDWTKEQIANGFTFAWRGRPELGATAIGAIVAKMRVAVDELIAAIAPKPLNDIDITIRSEWVYDPDPAQTDVRNCDLLIAFLQQRHRMQGNYGDLNLTSLRIVKGKMEARGPAAFARAVSEVVGYYNREEEITEKDRGGRLKVKKRDTGELIQRLDNDRKLDSEWAAFVRLSEHAPELADRYNRAYRGFVPRVYDESPVPLARFNGMDEKGNMVTVRPYIWASVRRAVERRGGILALDVGLGKTFCALLVAAAMRESGKARRIMVAVPNSVGPNWISEVTRILPDYRVLPIGFTPKVIRGNLRSTGDTIETLSRKLADFAAGLYDIAIVQHSTLLRFGVDEERAKALLGNRLTTARAVADELKKLKEKSGQINDAQIYLDQLVASDAKPEDIKKAKAKLARLTGSDVEELVEKVGKMRDQVKGTTREGLIEAQSTATTKAAIQKIEDQLETWDEIDALEAQIVKRRAVSEATIRNEVNDATAMESFIADRIIPPAVVAPTWDELGVDLLIVDEAHQFKNLYGSASRYGKKMKYMGALSADTVTAKCWSLFTKALAVREKNDGTGVLLLTATPLKNSPLEAYNLLSYCSDEPWNVRGISGPEQFIDRFCVPESEPALKVDGSFDYSLAVTKFTNLDELRQIFGEWVDVKAAMRRVEYEAAVNAGRTPSANIVPLDLPADEQVEHYIRMTELQAAQYEDIRKELSGGAQSSIESLCAVATAGLTPEEKALVKAGQIDTHALDELTWESELPMHTNPEDAEGDEEAEGGGKKGAKGGEVLKAMDRMTKLATDPALLGLHDPEVTIPNKYRAVAEVIKASRDGNGDCAHIVFSDYNETHTGLRDAISQIAGIPRERIKLVTGALSVGARQQVVDEFNGVWDAREQRYTVPPQLDVVIGNTPTMGEGLNLQARACSIHHVTLPWEPASIQQRNGRGVRQGNRYEKVTLHYYLTERSFDGYKLSLIKGKRAWMVGLLESAAKTTMNPGASLGGPCAILKALAADPEKAEQACACLEQAGVVKEIARRKAGALSEFAAYVGAYDSSRRAKEEETREYYRGQAVALRQKLSRVPDSIFPYKAMLDRAAETKVIVIPTTGRVYLEGAWYMMAGQKVEVVKIDLSEAKVWLRPMGSWRAPTEHTVSDYQLATAEVAPIDPPTPDEQTAAMQLAEIGWLGSNTDVKEIADLAVRYPTIYKDKMAQKLRSGDQLFIAIPVIKLDAEGNEAPWSYYTNDYRPSGWGGRGGVSGVVGEIVLPTGEDAERWLRLVRKLPREVRVSRRDRFQKGYEEYFGRTYPKDLRDESVD
jgi:hypothetical protein